MYLCIEYLFVLIFLYLYIFSSYRKKIFFKQLKKNHKKDQNKYSLFKFVIAKSADDILRTLSTYECGS